MKNHIQTRWDKQSPADDIVNSRIYEKTWTSQHSQGEKSRKILDKTKYLAE